MYHYYQVVGGQEAWHPVQAAVLAQTIEDTRPMFVTALAVNKLAEDLTPEAQDKLSYIGPLYIDWDGPNIDTVIPKVLAFIEKLKEMRLDLEAVRFYATGAKGFHCEIPFECFATKPPKDGVVNLPIIYKEMIYGLYVDTIDMRVYSRRRGRMWRQPNVERPNGAFKVQVSVAELEEMTAESYAVITSNPRPILPQGSPQFCADLAISFDRARQKVEERMKAKSKVKRDPQAKERAQCDSIMFMASGLGIKPSVGFHEIALQMAIIAVTAEWSEDRLIEECALLIANHQGNGVRYNSPPKRDAELRRLYRYADDNPMYDFSIGAIKSLLTHAAPDLDGIVAATEDIKEGIEEAAADAAVEGTDPKVPDEFSDVAGGVTLSKFGVYITDELGGKRRICAVSFSDIYLLVSMETGQHSAYEAMVLVNGRPMGRQTLELDTFQSLQIFNRFAQRLGHAMQGSETHVRGMFMRFVELAKKKGKVLYITNREGLDIVNVPHHEDPALREPFKVWADGRGVILDPRVRGKKGLEISFQGFPDPRGVFKTDLSDSPVLADWIEEPGNKDAMKATLTNMMTCQRADVISKMVGWYTACFYRMVFHKAYGKFPLLHVNGAAGAGKCLGRDTPVIMADGSVRKVQDVAVGDLLLGPDGGARKVLSLGRGRDQMYAVVQSSGDTYVVNSEHNLSLLKPQASTSLAFPSGAFLPAFGPQGVPVKVNVKDFCESSLGVQRSLRGWRPGAVTFHTEPQKLLLSPLWLGLWLTKEGRGGERAAALQSYGLLAGASIPPAYKTASIAVRQELLKGLLTNFESFGPDSYRFDRLGSLLAGDIAFVARSLGYAAQVIPLPGDLCEVRVIQGGSGVGHGIQVTALGEDDYYGFEIDGDHQFLLGDFTVTFNTEMNKTMASLFYYNQEPKMITPQSTVFAIGQHMSASTTAPLLLDEYKPAELHREVHNKLKLLLRDAYNARDVLKGGGSRESSDYRSLHQTQLVAPLVFIAEAAEEEAAISERVVLLTVVKPAASVSLKWLSRFHAWSRNKQHLSILGQHLATEVIETVTVESLQKEFDVIFQEAQDKYMLTEADLVRTDLDEATIAEKRGAKERSVYNFTVALFGLRKFRKLVDKIYGPSEFHTTFDALEAAVYTRMSDLQPATQAEWAKVLNAFASMSYSVDEDSAFSLRPGREYAIGQRNGRNVVEVALLPCYLRYRGYMRSTSTNPLFAGPTPFKHSIKDSPALLESGFGAILEQPDVFVFDTDELAKLGVGQFK